MKRIIKICSLLMAVVMLLSCVACGKNSDDSEEEKSYADIVLGEDYTDLNVKLTVMTNRTDLIADDPNVMDFQDYKRAFNEMYPNIDVVFEGSPDYDLEMSTRLDSTDWDICFIPADLATSELDAYFEPICGYDELVDRYEFIYMDTYNNQVYGIPSSYNTQGIVYNKKVWADAGITDMPKTPDDFMDALRKIKENTDAIPLFTNYASSWPLTAWDYYDTGVTGDGRYRYYVLPYEDEPFTQNEDRTGMYEVYHILYQAASEGLIEEDLNATNWELCKARINNGEIGCMMLGSWAVPQMQTAGSHPEDIGYMPFPVLVDGVQYATAGANFSYGINNSITEDKKLAAKIFVKFMIEESGYAYDQGGISILKDAEYTNGYEEFDGVELIMEVQPADGEEDVFSLINDAAGLGLDVGPDHLIRIIDSAVNQTETFEDIMAEWNAAWTAAQQQYLSDN